MVACGQGGKYATSPRRAIRLLPPPDNAVADVTKRQQRYRSENGPDCSRQRSRRRHSTRKGDGELLNHPGILQIIPV
jgi:hypothetical protein